MGSRLTQLTSILDRIIQFAPGDVSKRYLHDDPLISSGGLLKAATIKKHPPKERYRVNHFKPSVQHGPNPDSVRAREVIQKMRGGTATPEDKAFLGKHASEKASKFRDPAAWLKAANAEGEHQDLTVSQKGKIEARYPEERRLINAQNPQGKKAKGGGRPIVSDRGESGLLKTASQKRIQKSNANRPSMVAGRLRAESQAFRDYTARQLKDRHGLIQDIRKASHPLKTQLSPGVLAATHEYVKEEAGAIKARREAVHGGAMSAVKHRIRAGQETGSIVERHDAVRTLTEKLGTGAPMAPHEKQALAQSLNAALPAGTKPFTTDRITKIHGHLSGLHASTTSEAGVQAIRRKAVESAMPIINSRTATSSATKGYPALKKIGRRLGIAGTIGAGLLAARGIQQRRKENKENKEQRMSAKIRLIKFGRLEPITRLRIGKGTQSFSPIHESIFGSTAQAHLHRAHLAALRDDMPAFKEAGVAAGLFKSTAPHLRVSRHMNFYKSIAESAKNLEPPVSTKSAYKIGERIGRTKNAERAREQIDVIHNQAQSKIKDVTEGSRARVRGLTNTLRNERVAHERDLIEESSRADSEYARGRKSSKRLAIGAGTAGVAAGGATGYEAGKRKKETRFSRIDTVELDVTPLQKVRNKIEGKPKASVTAHAVTGGIEGAAGIYAVEPLLERFRHGGKLADRFKSTFKDSIKGHSKKLAIGAAVGAATTAPIGWLVEKEREARRKRQPIQFTISDEVHDARLYSNLRGMATLESRAKRKEAWEKLGKPTKKKSIITAAKSGLLRKPVEMKSRGKVIQFIVQPANRTAVTRDRYGKKIHVEDMTRAENNYIRSAIGGSAISALLRKRTGMALKPAAIVGAGAGLVSQAIVRHQTAKTKDQFGDRSYGAKRVDNAPGQAALVGAGAIATHQAIGGTAPVRAGLRRAWRAAGKIGRVARVFGLCSRQPIIQFERDWTDKWTTDVNVNRRSEDLYRWGKRAHGVAKDLRRYKKGQPILDERGREQTPELKKPWAKKALVLGGIGAGVYAVSRGRGAIKGLSAAADAAGRSATPIEKLGQYVEHGNAWKAVKTGIGEKISKFVPHGTGDTIRQAHSEIKEIIQKAANKPAAKLNKTIVGKVGDISTRSVITDAQGNIIKSNIINPAADAEKAAALKPHLAAAQKQRDQIAGQLKKHESAAEARRKKLHAALHPELSARGGIIRLAEYRDEWDVRDARGNSARIFAPPHQVRTRRPKEWHERKSNRDLLAAGVAGVIGVGGLGLGLRGGVGRGLRRAEAVAAAKSENKVNAIRKKVFRDLARTKGNPPIQAQSKDHLVYLNARLDNLIACQ